MKYVATVFVSVLIIVAVLIPGPNLPEVGVGGFDKIVHIGMFAVWAIAVRFDFQSPAFRFIIVFLAGLCFSLLTEVLQLLVEGRTFDVYDMIADGAGVVAGLLASGPVLRLLGKAKRN